MLKLLPLTEAYHNFKCGEIYCLTANSYKVYCCLCGIQLDLGLFPNHFENQHLSKNETSLVGTVIAAEVENDSTGTSDAVIINELVIIHPDEEFNPLSIDTTQQSDNEIHEEEEDNEDLATKENQLDNKSEKTTEVNKESANDEDWMETEDQPDSKNEDSDTDDDKKSKNKDDRPFPCSKCDRSYKSKRGLWNHLRINHNPNSKKKPPKKSYKCDQCPEVFRSERHLRGHKWKHTGISCDICGKTFTQTGNMMRHKIRHTGVKAHSCKECDFSFYTEKELSSHMIRHTGLMPIICEICGKKCRDHGVLTAHMRRHTGERPAKCQECGKSFFSFHDLNVHAVTHTKERPFSCDADGCNATFQRKKALRVHKKLHSPEKKHHCKICEKSFTQSSGLNSHMKKHEKSEIVEQTDEISQQLELETEKLILELI